MDSTMDSKFSARAGGGGGHADFGEHGKPQCGSAAEGSGDFDMTEHVIALFLVLSFSIFGAGFPVLAKRVKWIKVPKRVFFICKHFGTGVLVATAFVHLIPVTFETLHNPCLPDLFTEKYPPMPGVIMMAALFALFVLQTWVNTKTGGPLHSHSGPIGIRVGPLPAAPAPAASRPGRPWRPPMDEYAYPFDPEELEYEKRVVAKAYAEEMRRQQETWYEDDMWSPEDDIWRQKELPGSRPRPYAEKHPQSEMPPWFIVFYEQYVRHQHDMANMIKASAPPPPLTPNLYSSQKGDVDFAAARSLAANGGDFPDSPYIDVETGQRVDPALFKKMSTNISLLEGGILFHSVFVGVTISMTTEGFIVLIIAILFHQMFEGLGLGSRIAAVPYPRGSIRPWVLVVAFGTVAPIGQAIGLLARGAYDPNSTFGLIMVGVLNAVSAGMLLYAAVVDLLVEDFLSEEGDRSMTKNEKIAAFALVLLGAAGMSVVGAFA